VESSYRGFFYAKIKAASTKMHGKRMPRNGVSKKRVEMEKAG